MIRATIQRDSSFIFKVMPCKAKTKPKNYVMSDVVSLIGSQWHAGLAWVDRMTSCSPTTSRSLSWKRTHVYCTYISTFHARTHAHHTHIFIKTYIKTSIHPYIHITQHHNTTQHSTAQHIHSTAQHTTHTQHNTTHTQHIHNTTQHNTTQHNTYTTQHNTTQHNTTHNTQHKPQTIGSLGFLWNCTRRTRVSFSPLSGKPSSTLSTPFACWYGFTSSFSVCFKALSCASSIA